MRIYDTSQDSSKRKRENSGRRVVNGDKLMSEPERQNYTEGKMARNELRLLRSDANHRPSLKREKGSCCSAKVLKCCVLLFNAILLVSDQVQGCPEGLGVGLLT